MDNPKKNELSPFVRQKWGLKANREDDDITREIVRIFAEKKLSVDRASRILKDARLMIQKLSQIPYEAKNETGEH